MNSYLGFSVLLFISKAVKTIVNFKILIWLAKDKKVAGELHMNVLPGYRFFYFSVIIKMIMLIKDDPADTLINIE